MDRELPAHISHSQVSTYLSCAKRYYLEKVVNVPQVPAWWFVGGSAVHEVFEQYLKHRFAEEGR